MNSAKRVASAAVRQVEQAGRAVWRRRILRSGEDVTALVTDRSCLVLAPHPDDETLGCGATIARKRAAGTPVRVLVAADGRSSHRSAVIGVDELVRRRADEAVDACRELGVGHEEVVLLGFEDESLAARRDELAAAIAEQLDAVEPDEVRLPSRRDWHPDHRALAEALALALRGRRHRPIVAEHPVWLWVHGPWDAAAGGPWAPRQPVAFVRDFVRPASWPRAQLVDTTGFLGQKHRAILAHRTQTANLTGEDGWAVLDEEFLASFLLPYEIAFPSDLGR